MVDEKMNRSLQAVLSRAIDEASARRSTTVEAEHLLLALATDEGLIAAKVLADAGHRRSSRSAEVVSGG